RLLQTQRLAWRLRLVARRCVQGRQADLLWPSGIGIQWRAVGRNQRDAGESRAQDAALRAAAARRAAEGSRSHLGRAETRVRRALQGDHERRTAAAIGVSAVSG